MRVMVLQEQMELQNFVVMVVAVEGQRQVRVVTGVVVEQVELQVVEEAEEVPEQVLVQEVLEVLEVEEKLEYIRGNK